MRWTDAVHQQRSLLLWTRVALAIAIAAAFIALLGWHRALRPVRLSLPPQLPYGQEFTAEERDSWEIYTFAGYIWQQQQIWLEDGEREAFENLNRLGAFITPEFRARLMNELRSRGESGQLRGRTRLISPRMDYSAASVLWDGDGWQVELSQSLEERLRGTLIKSATVHYSIRVVELDVDPERNPWRLAIDSVKAKRLIDELAAG